MLASALFPIGCSVAVASLAAGIECVQPLTGPDPVEVLEGVFGRKQKQVCILIQTMKSLDPKVSKLQVKVEMDTSGRSKRTTLSPLSMQGMVAVDDGRSWTVYFPDHKQIHVQNTSTAFGMDPGERAELTGRNYSLKLQEGPWIAGRKTYRLDAKPNYPELASRTIFVDQKLPLILRYEVKEAGGSLDQMLDTLTAEFPARPEPSFYQSPADESWTRVRVPVPRTIRDPEKAETTLGFVPRIPDKLPLGFIVVTSQIIGTNEEAMAGIRITDGLAIATVYQIESRRKVPDMPPALLKEAIESKGVKYWVVGELAKPVKKKLIEVFVKR